MIVATIQLAKWRIIKDSRFKIHNATVKTGESLLAPTWDMVAGIKAGTMSHKTFVHLYQALIKERFSKNKAWFISLVQTECIAISCTCKSGEFCHRYLAVDALRALCSANNIPFEYVGEIFNEGQV